MGFGTRLWNELRAFCLEMNSLVLLEQGDSFRAVCINRLDAQSDES